MARYHESRCISSEPCHKIRGVIDKEATRHNRMRQRPTRMLAGEGWVFCCPQYNMATIESHLYLDRPTNIIGLLPTLES
jgi:hypothetical protein